RCGPSRFGLFRHTQRMSLKGYWVACLTLDAARLLNEPCADLSDGMNAPDFQNRQPMRKNLCYCGFLSAVVLALAITASAAVDVSIVLRPPAGQTNAFFVSNKAPLEPSPFLKLPIGSIRPKGWLLRQLQLEADGMTGHLPEISKWCKFDGNAWSSPDGKGHSA